MAFFASELNVAAGRALISSRGVQVSPWMLSSCAGGLRFGYYFSR